jgi:hypothetical protein
METDYIGRAFLGIKVVSNCDKKMPDSSQAEVSIPSAVLHPCDATAGLNLQPFSELSLEINHRRPFSSVC